jgi:fructosamine-3-kinase
MPEEPPSLLHGDLWSGNFITGEEGQPVIIDPAVYYGNREIELSFTQMFGGFDSIFYDAYREMYPLSPGFNNRVEVYNIYPYLVHVNLFGTSYLSGVERVIKRYT